MRAHPKLLGQLACQAYVTLIDSLAPQELGVVAQACDPRTGEVEAGE